MIDSIEVKEFDNLEGQLLDANVSYGEMTREYASYLMGLIQRSLLARRPEDHHERHD